MEFGLFTEFESPASSGPCVSSPSALSRASPDPDGSGPGEEVTSAPSRGAVAAFPLYRRTLRISSPP